MPWFLFQIDFEVPDEELARVIPVHREYVNKLFSKGILSSYSVSLARNMLWCVIAADSEQVATDFVMHFPLHPFFNDVVSFPLLFHNIQPSSFPGIVLN
ncbi:MAG: hypothetical protein EBZ77_08995 [Chitinophagia bacterium]|nr:hypothetical protein [Chitinophagia bacterium]